MKGRDKVEVRLLDHRQATHVDAFGCFIRQCNSVYAYLSTVRLREAVLQSDMFANFPTHTAACFRRIDPR